MVGLSSWMKDSKVDAPIRSPAAANTVFGFCARSCLTAPAITAAPASALELLVSRPWKSFVPRICTSTGAGGPSARSIPTISGSWSDAANGTVPSKNCVTL